MGLAGAAARPGCMPDIEPASHDARSKQSELRSGALERLYDAVGGQLYRYFYHQVGNRE